MADHLSLSNAGINNARVSNAEKIDIWREENPAQRITKKTLRKILGQNTFTDIDLSGADLSGATLDNIDFSGSNFKNARLTNATVFHTKFCRANFTGTDFTSTDLSWAIRDGSSHPMPKAFLIPLPGQWRLDIADRQHMSLQEAQEAFENNAEWVRQLKGHPMLTREYIQYCGEYAKAHNHVIEELAEIWGTSDTQS